MRHSVEANNGNCSVLDKTGHLDVTDVLQHTTSPGRSDELDDGTAVYVSDITADEIASLSDDRLQDLQKRSDPDITHFKEAAVTYIAGFVCRMIADKLKCDPCKNALETTLRCEDAHAFVLLKDRGGLMKPSKSVQTVCLQTERYLDRLVKIHKALPKIAEFRETLTAGVLAETCHTVFENLADHVLEFSVDDSEI